MYKLQTTFVFAFQTALYTTVHLNDIIIGDSPTKAIASPTFWPQLKLYTIHIHICMCVCVLEQVVEKEEQGKNCCSQSEMFKRPGAAATLQRNYTDLNKDSIQVHTGSTCTHIQDVIYGGVQVSECFSEWSVCIQNVFLWGAFPQISCWVFWTCSTERVQDMFWLQLQLHSPTSSRWHQPASGRRETRQTPAPCRKVAAAHIRLLHLWKNEPVEPVRQHMGTELTHRRMNSSVSC